MLLEMKINFQLKQLIVIFEIINISNSRLYECNV